MRCTSWLLPPRPRWPPASASRGRAQMSLRPPVPPTSPPVACRHVHGEAKYGRPHAPRYPPSAAPSAQPPITRWEYPGFVVYFENNHVVHTVVAPAKPEGTCSWSVRPHLLTSPPASGTPIGRRPECASLVGPVLTTASTDGDRPLLPSKAQLHVRWGQLYGSARRCGWRGGAQGVGPLLVIARTRARRAASKTSCGFFCAPGTAIEHFPAGRRCPTTCSRRIRTSSRSACAMLSTLPRLANAASSSSTSKPRCSACRRRRTSTPTRSISASAKCSTSRRSAIA